jgi:hypothetical protein
MSVTRRDAVKGIGSLGLLAAMDRAYGRNPRGFVAGSSGPARNYVGVNVPGVNYYSSAQHFINILKLANNPSNGVDGTWSPVPSGSYYDIQMDADGYPTSMTGISGATYTGFATSIFLGINYGGPTTNVPVGMTANTIYPPGSYTLQFLGIGTITISGDVSYTLTSTTAAGARGTFNITNATRTGIKFTVSGVINSSPGNYITAAACCQTSLMGAYTGTGGAYNAATTPIQNLYTGGLMFHPNFKATLANYSLLRFMDAFNTNSQLQGMYLGPAAIPSTATSATMYNDNGWDDKTYTVSTWGNGTAAGSTSAVLTKAPSAGRFNFITSDGQVRAVILVASSTTITWSGALTGTPTTALSAQQANTPDHSVQFTAAPSGTGGSTVAALAAGTYDLFFSDGQKHRVVQGASSTSVSWTGSITGNPTVVAWAVPINPWPLPTGTYVFTMASGQPIPVSCTINSEVITWPASLLTTAIPFGANGATGNQYTRSAWWHVMRNWSDRTLPTNFTYGAARGMPFEVAMQLCIEMSTYNGFAVDMWWNVPPNAPWNLANGANGAYDTTWYTKMAALAATGNDGSGIKLPGMTGISGKFYIEWSNETWNTNFEAYNYAQAVGGYRAPLSLNNYAMTQWHGIECASIGQAFFNQFGNTAFQNRITVSFGCQNAGNGTYGATGLGFQAQAPSWVSLGYTAPYLQVGSGTSTPVVTGFHIAPYFNTGGVGGMTNTSSGQADQLRILGLSTGDPTYAAALDEYFSLAYKNVGASGYTYASIASGGWIGDIIAQANKFYQGAAFVGKGWANLQRLSYEGGEGFLSSSTTGWNAFMWYVHSDQRMSYCYYDPSPGSPGHLAGTGLMPGLAGTGLQFLTQFNACAGWTAGNPWGAVDSAMQLSASASVPVATSCPKYQGLQNYILA